MEVTNSPYRMMQRARLSLKNKQLQDAAENEKNAAQGNPDVLQKYC